MSRNVNLTQLPYWLHVGNMLWSLVGVLPSHTTYDDDNFEVFNSFTWNRCLQESIPQRISQRGIDFVESMPGVRKSLKIQALQSTTWATLSRVKCMYCTIHCTTGLRTPIDDALILCIVLYLVTNCTVVCLITPELCIHANTPAVPRVLE
jgi:hypothetical protein